MRASLKLRIVLAMRGQMQKLEQLRAGRLSRFFPFLYSLCSGASETGWATASGSASALAGPLPGSACSGCAALSAGINSDWNDSATSFSNSSMLGNSFTSFSPNRMRNSFVVLYRMGRPITCLRPAVVISLRSSRVPMTPPESTPRMSLIYGTVTGCL